MTGKRFEVMDYFDSENKPIKAIRDTETTEIYSMDNELEANSTCGLLNTLHEEKEYWKQVASQYSNELNVFEHCKKYKTECKDIYWSSD